MGWHLSEILLLWCIENGFHRKQKEEEKKRAEEEARLAAEEERRRRIEEGEELAEGRCHDWGNFSEVGQAELAKKQTC